MASELKSYPFIGHLEDCPFCGKNELTFDEEEIYGYGDDRVEIKITCEQCKASGGIGKTHNEAIRLWNSRKCNQRVMEK